MGMQSLFVIDHHEEVDGIAGGFFVGRQVNVAHVRLARKGTGFPLVMGFL